VRKENDRYSVRAQDLFSPLITLRD
jgi:hypothetical protein